MQELKNRFHEMKSMFKNIKLNDGEIGKLTEKNEELSEQILDLRCRYMKENLIFAGIYKENHEKSCEISELRNRKLNSLLS